MKEARPEKEGKENRKKGEEVKNEMCKIPPNGLWLQQNLSKWTFHLFTWTRIKDVMSAWNSWPVQMFAVDDLC